MNRYFFILTCFIINSVNAQVQQGLAKIIVGPNIQVSNDGNSTHCEIKFATSPLDPNILAGGVIRCTPNNNIANDKYGVAYVSRDGGMTWESNEFKDVIQTGGGDPLAEFGSNGAIYFHSFGGGDSKNPNPNSLYVSKDNGKTWSSALTFGDDHYGLPLGGDHPQIAVDQSFGKYAGRVYITYWSAMSLEPGNVGWLVHSDDDCKSFVGPMKVTDYQTLATDILIASTGKVFFLFEETRKEKPGNINMLISDDGGASITATKNIPYHFPWGGNEKDKFLSPFFAIDNKSEKFKDRIYGIYTDTAGGKGRVKFFYSTDEGNSWTSPRLIDMNCPADADQSNIALAVNRFGILGIRWSDTRGMEGKGYNEYFTVSLDGGETFLEPVKVSTQPSLTLNFSNEIVKPYWTRTVDKQRLGLTFYRNTMSSWVDFGRTGGHYTQFAADVKGVFHDFWTDSRDGEAYQIYTSAIEVEQPGIKKLMTWDEMVLQRQAEDLKNNHKRNGPALKKEVSLSPYIALSFAKSSYDSVKQEISFPVRLKNISNKQISGPIKVVIDKIDTIKGQHSIPILLNAENKKKGIGGSFTFSKTLLPGETSETKIWKFKVKIPKDTENITKEQRDKVIEEDMKGDKSQAYLKSLKTNDIATLFFKITGNISE